jgi:hypothetical protein
MRERRAASPLDPEIKRIRDILGPPEHETPFILFLGRSQNNDGKIKLL